MSILINLLPDIRQAKQREHRRRQLLSGVSVTIWAVCGGIVVLLALYAGGQKVIISSLSGKITSKEAQLQSVPGLTDALTGQQHLASLSSLYQQRVYMTKFFTAYSASSPTTVTISSMSIDSSNNMVVDGTASTYAAVAKLARALEAANVTIGSSAAAANTPYFSNVTISTVGSGSSAINFTINAMLGPGVSSGSN